MSYPRFRRARAHKSARRTSGDISFTSTTWAPADAALDLALAECQAGDVIVADLAALIVTGGGHYLALDVATIVSGSPVNYFSSASGTPAGDGWASWFTQENRSNDKPGGAARYTLTAADLSAGVVTLRLSGRITAGSTASIRASTSAPLVFSAENIGPAQV